MVWFAPPIFSKRFVYLSRKKVGLTLLTWPRYSFFIVLILIFALFANKKIGNEKKRYKFLYPLPPLFPFSVKNEHMYMIYNNPLQKQRHPMIFAKLDCLDKEMLVSHNLDMILNWLLFLQYQEMRYKHIVL